MNRSILYGLVATWLVALALAAGWIVFALGKGAQTVQTLIVAILPLLVALLVSKRLLPLLQAPQKGVKKPEAAVRKAVRGQPEPGRKAAAQRQGLFGFSLFHRKATERRAAPPSPSADAASPQAVGTLGQQASTVPQRVAAASGATAPQVATAPVTAALLPPVTTPAVQLAPSYLSAGQPRETPVGADAAERIHAMQREVELLHVRLENELGGLVKAFESLQKMLGELDAVTAAIRGGLAQAEVFERFVEGLREPADSPATHALIVKREPAATPPAVRLSPTEDARPAAASVRPEPPPAPAAQPKIVATPVEMTPQNTPSAASQGVRGPAPEQSVEELLRGIRFDADEPGADPRVAARPTPPSETPERLPARPAPPQPAGRSQAAGANQQQAQGESLESALERAFGNSLEQSQGPARPSEVRTPPMVSPQPSLPRPASRPPRGVEEELADVLGNLEGWNAGATVQQEPGLQARNGGSGESNGAATVKFGAEAMNTPYTGTFFIMVKPLLGGTAFGKFWTALEKVLGVGKVVGSTPLRDKSALRLTVDMGKDQVMVSQLVNGIQDAEFHRIDDKNLEITLSDS